MKKHIFAAFAVLAMLSSGSAYAADSTGANNTFYVGNNNRVVISEKTNMGTLELWLDNETPTLKSFMLDLYLPEQFTMEYEEFNGEKDYIVDFNPAKARNYQIRVVDNGDRYSMLGTTISTRTLATGDAMLLSFNIVAPASYQDEYDKYGKISNIQFSNANPDDRKIHYFPDIEFEIYPERLITGIEDVVLDGGATNAEWDGEVYDLLGRRMPKGALRPGIYIINGKKTVVR